MGNGEDIIITNKQKEKIVQEVTNGLWEFSKKSADEIIEKQIRELLEDWIMGNNWKKLQEKLIKRNN